MLHQVHSISDSSKETGAEVTLLRSREPMVRIPREEAEVPARPGFSPVTSKRGVPMNHPSAMAAPMGSAEEQRLLETIAKRVLHEKSNPHTNPITLAQLLDVYHQVLAEQGIDASLESNVYRMVLYFSIYPPQAWFHARHAFGHYPPLDPYAHHPTSASGNDTTEVAVVPLGNERDHVEQHKRTRHRKRNCSTAAKGKHLQLGHLLTRAFAAWKQHLRASTQTAVAYYASRLLSAAFLALERNRKGKLDIHLRFQDGSRKEKVSALYERIRPRITIAYERITLRYWIFGIHASAFKKRHQQLFCRPILKYMSIASQRRKKAKELHFRVSNHMCQKHVHLWCSRTFQMSRFRGAKVQSVYEQGSTMLNRDIELNKGVFLDYNDDSNEDKIAPDVNDVANLAQLKCASPLKERRVEHSASVPLEKRLFSRQLSRILQRIRERVVKQCQLRQTAETSARNVKLKICRSTWLYWHQACRRRYKMKHINASISRMKMKRVTLTGWLRGRAHILSASKLQCIRRQTRLGCVIRKWNKCMSLRNTLEVYQGESLKLVQRIVVDALFLRWERHVQLKHIRESLFYVQSRNVLFLRANRVCRAWIRGHMTLHLGTTAAAASSGDDFDNTRNNTFSRTGAKLSKRRLFRTWQSALQSTSCAHDRIPRKYFERWNHDAQELKWKESRICSKVRSRLLLMWYHSEQTRRRRLKLGKWVDKRLFNNIRWQCFSCWLYIKLLHNLLHKKQQAKQEYMVSHAIAIWKKICSKSRNPKRRRLGRILLSHVVRSKVYNVVRCWKHLAAYLFWLGMQKYQIEKKVAFQHAIALLRGLKQSITERRNGDGPLKTEKNTFSKRKVVKEFAGHVVMRLQTYFFGGRASTRLLRASENFTAERERAFIRKSIVHSLIMARWKYARLKELRSKTNTSSSRCACMRILFHRLRSAFVLLRTERQAKSRWNFVFLKKLQNEVQGRLTALDWQKKILCGDSLERLLQNCRDRQRLRKREFSICQLSNAKWTQKAFCLWRYEADHLKKLSTSKSSSDQQLHITLLHWSFVLWLKRLSKRKELESIWRRLHRCSLKASFTSWILFWRKCISRDDIEYTHTTSIAQQIARLKCFPGFRGTRQKEAFKCWKLLFLQKNQMTLQVAQVHAKRKQIGLRALDEGYWTRSGLKKSIADFDIYRSNQSTAFLLTMWRNTKKRCIEKQQKDDQMLSYVQQALRKCAVPPWVFRSFEYMNGPNLTSAWIHWKEVALPQSGISVGARRFFKDWRKAHRHLLSMRILSTQLTSLCASQTFSVLIKASKHEMAKCKSIMTMRSISTRSAKFQVTKSIIRAFRIRSANRKLTWYLWKRNFECIRNAPEILRRRNGVHDILRHTTHSLQIRGTLRSLLLAVRLRFIALHLSQKQTQNVISLWLTASRHRVAVTTEIKSAKSVCFCREGGIAMRYWNAAMFVQRCHRKGICILHNHRLRRHLHNWHDGKNITRETQESNEAEADLLAQQRITKGALLSLRKLMQQRKKVKQTKVKLHHNIHVRRVTLWRYAYLYLNLQAEARQAVLAKQRRAQETRAFSMFSRAYMVATLHKRQRLAHALNLWREQKNIAGYLHHLLAEALDETLNDFMLEALRDWSRTSKALRKNTQRFIEFNKARAMALERASEKMRELARIAARGWFNWCAKQINGRTFEQQIVNVHTRSILQQWKWSTSQRIALETALESAISARQSHVLPKLLHAADVEAEIELERMEVADHFYCQNLIRRWRDRALEGSARSKRLGQMLADIQRVHMNNTAAIMLHEWNRITRAVHTEYEDVAAYELAVQHYKRVKLPRFVQAWRGYTAVRMNREVPGTDLPADIVDEE